MTPVSLSRDQVRVLWQIAGLTAPALTRADMEELSRQIDARMIASGAIRDSLRIDGRPRISGKAARRCLELRCKSFYFTDRQAVTFEAGGFIGFAGWADDVNVQPILHGFLDWLAIKVPGVSPGIEAARAQPAQCTAAAHSPA